VIWRAVQRWAHAASDKEGPRWPVAGCGPVHWALAMAFAGQARRRRYLRQSSWIPTSINTPNTGDRLIVTPATGHLSRQTSTQVQSGHAEGELWPPWHWQRETCTAHSTPASHRSHRTAMAKRPITSKLSGRACARRRNVLVSNGVQAAESGLWGAAVKASPLQAT